MKCTQEQKERLFNKTKPIGEKILKQIDETIFLQEGYLFKENNKPRKTAYCTCCQQRFNLDGINIQGIQISNDSDYKYMRHNSITHCPLCGMTVTVKDAGRGRSKLVDRGYAAVYQKIDNQTIALFTFAVMRDYSDKYDDVRTKYSEHYRIYYNLGEVHAFKKKNTSIYYLRETDFFSKYNDCYTTFEEMVNIPKRIYYPNGFQSWYYLYDDADFIWPTFFNVDVVEKAKAFKYSAFKMFISDNNEDISYKYLDFYCKHPVLCERLVKEGYGEILAQKFRQKGPIKLNYKAETVKGFFKMNNSELKILKQINDIKAVNVKSYGLPLTKQTYEYSKRENYSMNDIKFSLSKKEIPCECSELINYLVKQKSDSSIYFDYVKWLIKYKFELTHKSLFPRYLKQEHDKMMKYDARCEALKEAKKNEKKIKTFEKEILPFIQKVFTFNDDKFLIRPFSNIEEIIEEGQTQSICVGSQHYTNKYISGETYLFCLRQLDYPDTPFCTIEVSPNGTLIQARAKFNGSPTDEAKVFIDKWKNVYKSNLKKYSKKKEVA